jgi:membrane protein
MPLWPLRPSWPSLRAFSGLLLEAAKEFMRDRCHALGAALSFYALLCVGPFILLVLTLASVLLGPEAATALVIPLLRERLGPRGAGLIMFLLENLGRSDVSLRAVQAFGLALGAAGYFGQIKDSLETIWGTRREELGLKKVKKTLLEMLLALAAALLILLSLAAGVFFRAMIGRPESARWLPGGPRSCPCSHSSA